MVVLPKILGDHMVLQGNQPVRIWGWASAAETVTISLDAAHTARGTAVADQHGTWAVDLPPMKPGGPFSLTVEGENLIEIQDVLVGELWVASGQSNMEMPLAGFVEGRVKNDEEEIRAANYPEIRFFKIQPSASGYPLVDLSNAGEWCVCSPQTAPRFSAVAYSFARELLASQKTPVGVVDATWGGTPAEAWVSLPALTGDPALAGVFDEFNVLAARYGEDRHRWDLEDASDAAARARGETPSQRLRYRDFDKAVPGTLFNAMISPIRSLRIRGVIWYQGETSATPLRAPLYHRLLPALIQDWRRAWQQPDLPFLYVQLANWNAQSKRWPIIREAQRRALLLRNTAMVVTIDVGDRDNLHPPDKQTVGHRLALAARTTVYHEQLEFSGPLYAGKSLERNALRVHFHHADGLHCRENHVPGFEIAGSDGVFLPAAQANIEGPCIVVSHPEIPLPSDARYGWDDDPKLDLYNSAGLPASPFSTEM